MAKYTVLLSGDKRQVFEADSLVEARAYAKTQGWDSTLVHRGDWATYPSTGYPEQDWVTAIKESDTPLRGRTALNEGKEYLDYKAFTETEEGQGYPAVGDINDYVRLREGWREYVDSGGTGGVDDGTVDDERPPGMSDEQWAEYQAYMEEQRARQAEYDKHTLDPAEAARRREEAYAESRYAAQERYHEQPRYQEKFASWVKGQSDMSGALEQYVTGKYPSLRAQFESQISPLTGFETREQARAEATKRESGWQSWLAQRQPDTKQEYWGQRPQDRGERMFMYQPTMRAVNW